MLFFSFRTKMEQAFLNANVDLLRRIFFFLSSNFFEEKKININIYKYGFEIFRTLLQDLRKRWYSILKYSFECGHSLSESIGLLIWQFLRVAVHVNYLICLIPTPFHSSLSISWPAYFLLCKHRTVDRERKVERMWPKLHEHF